MSSNQKTLGVLLFDKFELLDVFGPLEMLGYVPDITVHLIAQEAGAVRSTQGPAAMADFSLAESPPLDVLLVPGGLGTRAGVSDPLLLAWIADRSAEADWVLSVCTGSALLARAGVLDGHRATSNKVAFEWVREQGPRVEWVETARWVQDGRFVTSSGVAAGIDMSLAVIEQWAGSEFAARLAHRVEYVWQKDPDLDPFSRVHRSTD